MKRTASCLVALGLLSFCAAAQAQKISQEPAATLLLPYFEVDFSNPGVNTLFSINNAYSPPALANVTLWSDLSIPVLNFQVELTGYDVETINLYDILARGVLPQAAAGPGCAQMPASVPPAFLVHLQRWLTGRASPIFGMCAGRNLGDDIARGYITVDTVRQCTFLNPSDPGYFPVEATEDNVLWGDSFYVDAVRQSVAFHPLVHIPALSPAAVAGDYTFYGRYVSWIGTDNRRPLATSFATRFSIGGIVDRTDLIVWRDPKVNQQPFSCARGPVWYPLGEEGIAVFDEQENLDMVLPGTNPFPAAAQRVEVGSSDLPVPFLSGWINPNLNFFGMGSVPPGDPFAAQGWVGVSMESGGTFTIGYDAIQIDSASNALHQVPP